MRQEKSQKSQKYQEYQKYQKYQKYLIIDDLSPNLRLHPIHVPIPPKMFDAPRDVVINRLVALTLKVYKDLMKLGYFEWDHSYKDISIDGFSIRFDKLYPSIST
jgi:hypothetical protein